MALTPFIRAAQFATRAVTAGLAAGVDAASYVARAIVLFPTPFLQAAQMYVRTVLESTTDLQAAQFITRAVIVRYPGNPKVRAWGYSQDGHDFYVLHLGMQGTIVYDATTGSWSQWASEGRPTWRATYGLDWLGMAKDNYDGGAATQVVAGDEVTGVLWTLDPSAGVDDHPTTDETVPFTRAVRGGIPTTERNNLLCNAVWLRVSTGQPVDTDTSIYLLTSDDQGKTWTNRGGRTVNAGEYMQTFYWLSLGLIRPPARIFEFVDAGAMVRIDGADVDTGK